MLRHCTAFSLIHTTQAYQHFDNYVTTITKMKGAKHNISLIFALL
ncbi:hypothetical protein DFO54_103313 [Erwinia sp. AG740]|jgi:hypothetical protein|nr:hypothetical protein DFO54_103313 [Erwinia sp. AG740]